MVGSWVPVLKFWGSEALLEIFILYSAVKEFRQESPAHADKPVRRESMPKIAPIRRENKLQTS